ncbi:marine proteobacterial sortase target protein [Shewanella youngdeokensis]|uniref:Marine proteobacterial sortase target protein n=1 Tax=Shewanella youngdeokensis TaxID=2999068 RepID=A0ABZ0K3S7_9GAMM|nr:marine proteobacterial sortase target protein [Shewanella sp. DAU334]
MIKRLLRTQLDNFATFLTPLQLHVAKRFTDFRSLCADKDNNMLRQMKGMCPQPTLPYLWFLSLYVLLSLTVTAQPLEHDVMSEKGLLVDDIQQGSLITVDTLGHERVSLPMVTEVSMQVSGWTNRVLVRHEFYNAQPLWLNGEYVFPLPNSAAVDGLKLIIGDRVIEGEIKPKQTAKALFNAAQKAGKKASLLQQIRPNLFSAKVANLAPGETLIVQLNYQQQVDYEQGQFSLRFPMVAAPRYQPGSVRSSTAFALANQGESQHVNYAAPVDTAISDENNTESKPFNRVDIDIQLDAGMPINDIDSPYHQVVVSHQTDNKAHISLTAAKANSDFVLNWRPQVGHAPTVATFSQQGKSYPNAGSGKSSYKHSANTQYALMMLMPPKASNIKAVGTARELILVIDTSGSMSGEALEQAKAAIIYALEGLDSHDSFNVLQFNSQVYAFSEQSVKANTRNVAMAKSYVGNLYADGGTEMALALNKALVQPMGQAAPGLGLRQVMFVTDGAVGNEAQLFNQIRNQLQRSRLFTVGIGSAPNSHFMERAAEFGRGTYTYIGKQSEVKSKMVAMLDKLQQPTVTDVELRFADGTVPDYWPATIPDLYAHEPVMVAIKLTDFDDRQLVVSGKLAGQLWQQPVLIATDSSAKGLDLIWARKKIAALELSKERANRDRIEANITAISLNYHVMSAYTSLVAIDKTPVRSKGVTPTDARVVPHTPKGWQRLPQTATSSVAFMLFGAVLLGLSLLYGLSFYRGSSKRHPLKRAKLKQNQQRHMAKDCV